MTAQITTLELTPQGVRLCRAAIAAAIQKVASRQSAATFLHMEFGATTEAISAVASREMKLRLLQAKFDVRTPTPLAMPLKAGECETLRIAVEGYNWEREGAQKHLSNLSGPDGKTHTKNAAAILLFSQAIEVIVTQLPKKEEEDGTEATDA